ncbi:dioxygenase family protein [Candidatus Nitrospira bockiana]
MRCHDPRVPRRRALAALDRGWSWIAASLLWLAAAPWAPPAIAEAAPCLPTPRQTEGPYYPPKSQIESQLDQDNDLTRLAGREGTAKGRILYVMGQVRDERCRPIEGAVVEIWQAAENGRYRHPRDRDNPAPLDPGFQYWGKSVTDKDGRYLFKTIKPGAYQAGPRWTRPPHIHFKVRHPAFRELTTQLYFSGDPHQSSDYILNDVPGPARERVIAPIEPAGGPDYEPGAGVCRFDLTLF